ncbi:MAG: 2-amino-4-hydroxy-6-hydroxymethyldihydropteridinepyrophosphokinase (EC [uncultured Campylobacterales bacterium]|uniref:2-amino-4-hydroxy-6-hydroxymethyldihydropteridine pyrophosphokinase n=1 Tax=uncultured Campylobacterales bacterium TaxID=352960 RepID=A0A6S6SKZ4_9BACT|nr:MAG: 2-amino-4-hydroxy-6-hydroxymethyldihydropteridinepyrophosphokinase (EC [uncultured Campylobacterales bacterium]
MVKVLDSKNSLYYEQFYPYKTNKKSSKKNISVLGVGGNIGDSIKTLKRLFFCLKAHKKIAIIQTSPILKNPPFGYLKQAYFYNAVIQIKTDFSATELLQFAHYVEKKFNRKRSFKNAPRTLDIDIITYNNDKFCYKKGINIPHPKYRGRPSVMIPLKLLK